MRRIFIDTAYWIAILNPSDTLHTRAIEITQQLFPAQLFTSEMVLTELLNHYCASGSQFRRAAADLVWQLQQDETLSIIPQTNELFLNAFELYQNRVDKAWSHTDCASFCLMEMMQIREALTYDKHFEQAGFIALLRE